MTDTAIEEFVQRSSEILEAAPQMDEQNTKAKVITPFIELLGWDIYSNDVKLEYAVQIGSGNSRVDYALEVDGTPKVLVEAKARHRSIGEDHVSQLRSYMRQLLEVEWGIVTNGEEFHVYTKTDGGEAGEVCIGEYDLEDLADQPELFEVLSREAIESGEAAEAVARLERIQTAIEQLDEHKEAIAEDVVADVQKRLPETLETLQVETEALSFVDKLVRSLEAEASLTAGTLETHPEGEPVEGGGAVAGSIRRAAIEGSADASVAVFPCKESGIPFLEANNAWGFVRIGQVPEFAAFYISRTDREVRYVARVADVVAAREADLDRPLEDYVGEQAEFDERKKVVLFEPGSLYELEDPIPYGSKYPQSLQYTTLGALREADLTDDLF